MKGIKIILSLLLIFIGLLFTGEFSLEYIDNFTNDLPSTTMYFQSQKKPETMVEDILQTAKVHDISFFVLKSDLISANHKTLTIYQSDPKVTTWLSVHKGIVEQTYNSLFMGEVGVKFAPYQNISPKNLEICSHYYLIGEPKAMKAFKIALVNTYGGNHPKFPETQIKYYYTLIALWTIVFGLCLLLTALFIQGKKKTVLLKVLYGENRLNIVLKEALIDLFLIGGGALLCQKALLSYTNCSFRVDIFYGFLAGFILLNSLLYLSFLHYHVQKLLGNKTTSPYTLLPLYILKLISIIVIALLLTTNVALIRESLSFLSQESFFKSHQSYYYTNLNYLPRNTSKPTYAEDNARLKEIFYQKNYEKFQPILLAKVGMQGENDIILTNHNTLPYLESKLPFLKERPLKEGYYYLLPQALSNEQSILDSLDSRLESYIGKTALAQRKVLDYQEDLRLISINDFLPLNSKISKNPLIILDNTIPQFDETSITGNPFRMIYDRNIMYKLDKTSFDDFIQTYQLTSEIHAKSNVYAVYTHGKLTVLRVLKMSFVLSIILVVLEIIILLTLIKLAFRLNAYTISLKKILGYTLWERYFSLAIASFVGILLAEIIFVIVSLYTHLFPILSGTVIILIVAILEQILVTTEIKRLEQHSIPQVLKGEFR